MDILNKPIDTFDFEKVVAFCKERYPEGIQIDYKKDFPKNGFAKHFAAFSNTRGGIIIIGVEEDKKSGVPTKWEGIKKDAKQIEKIHQEACNVEPIPSYDIYTTDEVEEKCFVLIRINEGDKTPYYAQNDSNVWVRTGNVSNPIDIASPDGLELMFGKREKATKARDLYLKIAEENYNAGLEREEKKRQREMEEAKKREESIGKFSRNNLEAGNVNCIVAIQPFYPKKALANPRDIKIKLNELRVQNGRGFPDYNMEAIPQGLFHFLQLGNGYIECQQIFGQGLIYSAHNVTITEEEGSKFVPIAFIVGRVLTVLQFAKSLYNHFGYKGVLDGFISLEGMKGVHTRVIVPSGYNHWKSDDRESFLPNYEWNILLDTNMLNSKERLKEWFFRFVKEIYWGFGYEDVRDERINKFIEQNELAF